ncbi:MAG: anaerobic sulfatase maturase [Anaerolineales bacterium]|nr:anaerobic sulfatase maturase [Chloroflexota bacterium]MBL6980750.1 anaerobic sulfatase maturase [Anaerolineales bacterium]
MALTPPPAFHVMTKPRGAVCNLDCKYCYFLKKEDLYPDSDLRMGEGTLESYVRQYIEAQRVPEVTFAWQGGEPTLMGLEFFEKAVAFQKKYRKPGMKVINALQTNGTTLDDDWCAFFKKHDFLIGLSLDGPQELHNRYRVDKGGKATFERVMKGLEYLKKHQVEFNILTTVHSDNVEQPLDVYRFLRGEVGTQFIQFIPIVERKNDTGYQEGFKITKRSVTGKGYGQFLSAVFDEWVRRDVGQIFVQIFDVALGVWYGQRAGLCIFEETCGLALAMEHNGDLYSCDHYVEPRYFLGNVDKENLIDLVTTENQAKFGTAKRDKLPRYCCECEVRFVCNGGCPKNRIRRTPDGEEGLNYLCEGYKAFFKHIDEPMRVMIKLLKMGRAPADIMMFMREN